MSGEPGIEAKREELEASKTVGGGEVEAKREAPAVFLVVVVVVVVVVFLVSALGSVVSSSFCSFFVSSSFPFSSSPPPATTTLSFFLSSSVALSHFSHKNITISSLPFLITSLGGDLVIFPSKNNHFNPSFPFPPPPPLLPPTPPNPPKKLGKI